MSESPANVTSVAAESAVLRQCAPLTEIPTVASLSMAVNAKLSVFQLFHPSLPNKPTPSLISCSILMPNPYFRVPIRRDEVTSGLEPVRIDSVIASAYVPAAARSEEHTSEL